MRFTNVFKLKSIPNASLMFFAASFAFSSVQAKTFTNSYVSFELPDRWDCQLDHTEWVCRPVAAQEQQQAIIILTAKEVGPSDSLPAYEAHLKTPRQIASRSGTLLMSEVLTVDSKRIGDQPWVDGFHKSSEVPNYLTRYLATTKDKIAVLVTFSAHQLYYSKYSQDFLRAIGSLRVIAPKSMGKGSNGSASDGPFGTASNPDLAGGDLPAEEQPGAGGGGRLGNKTKSVLALAIILAALGGYMLIKKGKKKR
jgi:hypothetical protein